MNQPLEPQNYWRKCTSCKKEIPFQTKYWVCNVSTCNRKRTGLVFCSVSCWDAHVPVLNHRESWAEERVSANRNSWLKEQYSEQHAGLTVKQDKKEHKMESTEQITNNEKEVLVVVSKLKNYIRATSGMNTAGDVADILSDKMREICMGAIEHAKQEGRKTVMARDFV